MLPPNHLALLCELSKAKKKNKKNPKKLLIYSVPVVEDGAKREGVVLLMMNVERKRPYAICVNF